MEAERIIRLISRTKNKINIESHWPGDSKILRNEMKNRLAESYHPLGPKGQCSCVCVCLL